ncbi:MAG: S8 family serine peptidase, partial [Methanothrix sp.]|nr:S8 family serine peptidase [Methanothrix sp.]
MNAKQVMIFVDQGERDRRSQAEAGVSRILATYPGSILAEVNEEQAELLTSRGFQLETVADIGKIKLRSIEFDPSVEVPVGPKALSLSAADIVSTAELYWIVQFVGPAKEEWIEAVQKIGGSIGDYVPENAFLVRMTPTIKDQVSKLDFVNWVGPFQPSYKVSPLLMGVRGKITPAAFRKAVILSEAFKPTLLGNLRVLLHRTDDVAAVQKKVESLGGTVISAEEGVLRISLDPSHIAALAVLPSVQWIEPYVMPKLANDVSAGIIGVQPVWSHHGLDGEGQIIAVADTGIDTGVNDATIHDDFEGRIAAIHSWAIPAWIHPYLDNASWDDGAADLESGHGTHVAGSVLGNGARSSGGIRGMAHNA